MKKLTMSHKITPVFAYSDGDKKYHIVFTPITKRQQKEIGHDAKALMDLFSDSNRIERNIKVLEEKMTALADLGRSEDVVKTSEKLEKLYAKYDKIDEEFKSSGGLEALEESAKQTMEIAVSGDDKETVLEIAEEYGYSSILGYLNELVEEAKGKHGTK